MADKTMDGILREIRARASAWPDKMLEKYDLMLADRIEDAYRRDVSAVDVLRPALSALCHEVFDLFRRGREAGNEGLAKALDKAKSALASASSVQDVAVSKTETTTGDSGRLRSSVDEMLKYADYVSSHNKTYSAAEVANIVAMYARSFNAAISNPRNCDIGTVNEQKYRFMEFCARHINIRSCDCPCSSIGSCELAWAQLPYDAKEGCVK